MTSAEFRARQGLPPPGMTAAQVSERSKRFSPAKPQIRIPAKRKMNKGEQEYLRILEQEFPAPSYYIRYEAITFRLHCGTLYKVDFTVWRENLLRLAVECKGRFQHKNASKEKFKQAVAEWPNIQFRFAQKMADSQWATT